MNSLIIDVEVYLATVSISWKKCALIINNILWLIWLLIMCFIIHQCLFIPHLRNLLLIPFPLLITIAFPCKKHLCVSNHLSGYNLHNCVPSCFQFGSVQSSELHVVNKSLFSLPTSCLFPCLSGFRCCIQH